MTMATMRAPATTMTHSIVLRRAFLRRRARRAPATSGSSASSSSSSTAGSSVVTAGVRVPLVVTGHDPGGRFPRTIAQRSVTVHRLDVRSRAETEEETLEPGTRRDGEGDPDATVLPRLHRLDGVHLDDPGGFGFEFENDTRIIGPRLEQPE